MSDVVQLELVYGGGDGQHFTLRKYFITGSNQDYTGGNQTVDLTTQASGGAGGWTGIYVSEKAVQYAKCLEALCEPATQIKGCFITQFNNADADWNDRVTRYYSSIDLVNFTPVAGNTPKAGPRGKPFMGARQSINATHKYGWLRWHYIAGNLMTKPDVIALGSMPAQFQEWFPLLRNLGGGNEGYGALSGAVTTHKQIVNEGLPEVSFHFGIRNG